jgi:hypothetical protein
VNAADLRDWLTTQARTCLDLAAGYAGLDPAASARHFAKADAYRAVLDWLDHDDAADAAVVRGARASLKAGEPLIPWEQVTS